MVPREPEETDGVLRKAAASIGEPSPGAVTRVPHPLGAQGDSLERRLWIGTERCEGPVHLVEEADLRRVEQVRDVLRRLGSPEGHDMDRYVPPRSVEPPQ